MSAPATATHTPSPPARARAPAPDRKRQLAAIHAAAKAAGLDTADRNPHSEYRTLVLACTGKLSSADASDAGRARLLARLQGMAQQTSAGTKTRATWQIEQLWAELGKLRALRDPTAAGLAAFLQGQCGVALVRSLDGHQARNAIEALKAWKSRATRCSK